MPQRRDPEQRSTRAFTPHNPQAGGSCHIRSVQSPAVPRSRALCAAKAQQFRPFPCSLGSPRALCTECIPQHTFRTTHIVFDLEWRPEVYCRLFVHILALAQMFQHIPASLLALRGKKEQNQKAPVQTIISQIHVHNPKAITSDCHKLYFTMKVIFSQTVLGFDGVWF